MKVSVVIAYYKNLSFLKLLLDGFMLQTNKQFELVIAEDDNAPETIFFLAQYREKLNVKHVSQEDKGFRKCTSLNRAIKAATSDYIVFIDGDCIPHKKFIESYIKLSSLDCCFGRRVMLSDKHTAKLIDRTASLSLFDLIVNGSKQLKHSVYLNFRKPTKTNNKGIWGCNWGIQKRHLLNVNGFDEDYILAGIGEDVDIEWRLRKANVKILYAKHLPIVYHLHHKEHYDEAVVNENKKQLVRKQKEANFRCVNGLES